MSWNSYRVFVWPVACLVHTSLSSLQGFNGTGESVPPTLTGLPNNVTHLSYTASVCPTGLAFLPAEDWHVWLNTPKPMVSPPHFNFYREYEISLSSQCLSAFCSSWSLADWRSLVYPIPMTADVSRGHGGIVNPFPFTAQPPCCSRCWIEAGGSSVSLYYWPASPSMSSSSMLANSLGFSL